MADTCNEDGPRTGENMTMLQGFEWYVPADQKHWVRLEKQMPQLKRWGIDNIWLPPGCKGSSQGGNGYDIYDLYDLGEFDQKGGVATKWGTKAELVRMAEAATRHGVGLYWDAVLNHKFAADRKEKCHAHEVDDNDRTRQTSDVYEISAWTGFDFPGRKGQYSEMRYHWYHFSGVDFDGDTGRSAIFQIRGDSTKGWADEGDVDCEKGNYDYLMGSDLDFDHGEVAEDVLNWGQWLATQLPLQGFRFDAIKHFSEDFLRTFITRMDETYGAGWFVVGEFWKDSIDDMVRYLDRMGRKFSLFDAPLVYNFSEISQGDSADMRRVFDDTLVARAPVCAVTLVMNHDTQPQQALQAPVADWFKPLAYALILLRDAGYPCVFYGDLYGMDVGGARPAPPAAGGAVVPRIMLARKLYAYGAQAEYFDFPTCLGLVRYGTWDRPFGCAAVMSNAGPGCKRMHVGEHHAGETWTDVLGWSDARVEIGADGFAEFPCGQCSVSIFVNRAAKGRRRFRRPFDCHIYEQEEALAMMEALDLAASSSGSSDSSDSE